MLCSICNKQPAHPAYITRCEDCYVDSMATCEPNPALPMRDCKPRNQEKEIREGRPDDYELRAMRVEGVVDDD